MSEITNNVNIEKTTKNKKKKVLFITIVTLSSIIGVLLSTVGGYLIYVSAQYYRIKDNLDLTNEIQRSDETLSSENITGADVLSIMTYNVGFGAYSHEFSFFMDSGEDENGNTISGKYGTAISKDDVEKNLNGTISQINSISPDFLLLQEVDEPSTRSKGVNMLNAYEKNFDTYDSSYAVNFHSSFLMYPILDPHGSANSGIASFSKYEMESALRRSFPVDSSWPSKFFDLDRCFSIMKYPLQNDKHLTVINIHMSAYDSGGTIRKEQVAMLNEVLKTENSLGNYVVAGGDFNHDITEMENPFPTKQPKPEWVFELGNNDLTDGYSFVQTNNAPTCRSTDAPYTKGFNYAVVVDGFIVSDNIDVKKVENLDYDFMYSDHNPVLLEFSLNL